MTTSNGQCAVLMAILALVVLANTTIVAGPQSADESTVVASPAFRAPGGLRLGYNLDHAEALAAFHDAVAADPGNPRAYRLTAAIAWIKLLFEQGAITVDDYLGQARADLPRDTPPDAVLDRTFHDALRQAIALSEDRLRTHPSDPDAHYQVGAAYGYLASYTATIQGRVLGSLGAARRAYQEHQRTLELDPGRRDAGLVVGMYRYSISSLPKPLRLLARLAGFSGDRTGGLRLIEAAASYSSDAQPNALFALILIYNREARYDDALRAIGELQQRFPRNRLLWLEAGQTALRAGRPAEAEAALEEGFARLSHDPRPRALGEEARWRYARGATLVALSSKAGDARAEADRGAAAEAELRTALTGTTRDWLRGRIHKELGKLADLARERPRALAEYRQADRLCRQDHDGECADEVKNLMRAGYR